MKTAFKFAAVLTLLTGLAFGAVNFSGIDSNRWIRGGLYVMPQSISAQLTTTNSVTRMLAGSATIDFASGSIVCTDSAGITITGAQAGDPCFVGPPAAIANNSSFTCYVSAADTVKVRHCPAGTSIDPASATYNVRVISNQ